MRQQLKCCIILLSGYLNSTCVIIHIPFNKTHNKNLCNSTLYYQHLPVCKFISLPCNLVHIIYMRCCKSHIQQAPISLIFTSCQESASFSLCSYMLKITILTVKADTIYLHERCNIACNFSLNTVCKSFFSSPDNR